MARAGKHLSPGEIHEPLPAVSHANQHVVSFLMLGQLSCQKGLPLKRDCHFGKIQSLKRLLIMDKTVHSVRSLGEGHGEKDGYPISQAVI